MFLFIFCEVANYFVSVREIWVVKGIVPVDEGQNIISLYAISACMLLGQNSQCMYYSGYSMESFNNFQNALPSDFELLRIKVLIFCIVSKLTKVKHIPEHKQKSLQSFFRIFFCITQVLYWLTLNSHKSLFSRYTAGYVSDSNKYRIFSELKYWQNITFF